MKNDGAGPDAELAATLDAVLPRQRQLWADGNPQRVETLLEQFPVLRGDRDAILDLINHEIVLRTEFGEAPALPEYLERFPAYKADLEMLFEVHQIIEGKAGEQRRAEGNEDQGNTTPFGPATGIGPRPGASDDRASPAPPRLFDLAHFSVQEILGQGGMGVVYKATDHRLKRTVALKMIRGGGGHEELRRFQGEAEAVARLHHPHIVQIFDVGEHLEQPYFALEFVDGGSLTRLLQGDPQPAVFAAQMVEILARAVHHAHGQGIIHRDLKPANILLQRVDMQSGASMPAGVVVKDGVAYLPKVADFGLAKQVDPDSQASQTQAIVGTPSYMAPEQAGDFSRRIGAAADVYALGAILYEMITGRPPFRGASVMETLDQVRKIDPVAPTRLQPQCPRDLETICLKCLKKDPAARFASAAELADDLERFLGHEPIHARPTSKLEHAWLWCRRNPRVAVLSGSLVVVVLAALVISIWYGQRAWRGEAKAYAMLYASEISLGQRYWQEIQGRRMERLLETLRTAPPGQSDLRDFEWYYLQGLLRQDVARMPAESCVAYSPDGKLLATGGPGNTLLLMETAQVGTGKPLWQRPAHALALTAVAFDRKGEHIFTGSEDRTAKLWRVRDGELMKTFDGHREGITSVAIDPVSGAFATTSTDRAARLWEADGSTRLVLDEHDQGVNQGAFSPDGKWLATACTDGKVRLWNTSTGELERVLEGQGEPVLAIAFAPNGRSIVSGGMDKTIRQWDAATGKLLTTFPALPQWVQRLAFRPDGKRLAAMCRDMIVYVWDCETDAVKLGTKPARVFRGLFNLPDDMAFHPTERWLATVAHDKQLRIWDADRDPECQAFNLEKVVQSCALCAGGTCTAAIVAYDGSVSVFDVDTGTKRPIPARGMTKSLALSNDGRLLALGGKSGSISLWELPAGTLTREWFAHTGPIGILAVDGDGLLIASADRDGKTHLWNTATGQEAGTASRHDGKVESLVFSADGRWLASCGTDKVVRIWDVRKQAPAGELIEDGKSISSITFAPGGELLAVVGELADVSKDKVIDVWDWRRGKLLHTLEGHSLSVDRIAFSPSGARLASAGAVGGEGKVTVWDLTTGKDLLLLQWPGIHVFALEFDAKADRLVLVGNGRFSAGGQIRVWDARAGRERR
jgi:eukaryotic-like serine/threonine-protein kinase